MSLTLDSGLTAQQIADAQAGDAHDAAADAAMGSRAGMDRLARLMLEVGEQTARADALQDMVSSLRARLAVYEPTARPMFHSATLGCDVAYAIENEGSEAYLSHICVGGVEWSQFLDTATIETLTLECFAHLAENDGEPE